ncbi:MAG TPA: hypothetical protein VEK57_10420 [Thermoanaerobaculia bacterium]|nr:hypothetical protein [Thermoanaerobaculia bacterium]
MPRHALLPVLLAALFTPSLFAAADREASRAAILIPVAGTVSGANGTRFQTDVTLTTQGHDPFPVLVDVYWLPQNARGTGAPVVRLTLQPREIELFEDFVTRTLGKTGLGSVIFRTVEEDGTADLAGRIDAYARVWTPVPGGRGTMSQGVPASTLYSPDIDDFQPIAGMIYGLRHDASFRSNYGIVNMSAKAMTFTVAFLANGIRQREETISLEPSSMTQRPVPSGVFGAVTIEVTPHQESPATYDLGPWTAYGSSVDNITGDAWFAKAQSAYPHNEGPPCAPDF